MVIENIQDMLRRDRVHGAVHLTEGDREAGVVEFRSSEKSDRRLGPYFVIEMDGGQISGIQEYTWRRRAHRAAQLISRLRYERMTTWMRRSVTQQRRSISATSSA